MIADDLTDPMAINQRSSVLGDWIFREIIRDIGESTSVFYILIPIVCLILVGVVPMLIIDRMSKKKQKKEDSENTINYRPLEPSRSGKE